MMLTGMLVPGLPPSLERVGELAAPPPPLAAQSLASLGAAAPATPAAGKKRPLEEEEQQQLLHLVLKSTNTIKQGCIYFNLLSSKF